MSDRVVPDHLRTQPELWSRCISGAFQEDAFLSAFTDAGFPCVSIVARGEAPWRVVEGIEFRSVTVVASKGDERPAAPAGGTCC